MNAPHRPTGPRSASGVRRGGDRFQDLIGWSGALQLIRPDSRYKQVEFEINGVGNLDDVVLRSASATDGDLYSQVKWATNSADLLDEDFFTSTARSTGKSFLRKLYASWNKVTTSVGPSPTIRLITNRSTDPTHPLLGNIDGLTDLLTLHTTEPPTSNAGRALTAWAEHVQATRRELLDMLSRLQFHTGRTVSSEQEHVQTLMALAGLEATEDALQRGLNIVTGWILAGQRIVTAADVRHAVEKAHLHQSDPSALLVVQAIDIDAQADEATIALNWVDLFEPVEPRARAAPSKPESWDLMDREITDTATRLEHDGWKSTIVRGALRQATFFRIGTALPATRGHTLKYFQGGTDRPSEWWATNTPHQSITAPTSATTTLDQGSDLAVAVGVAAGLTSAVITYLRQTKAPVRHLLTIEPASGPNDQSITGPGQAVAYAQRIRDWVRQELEVHLTVEVIHLFLAGPGGLALLLGHRWNRLRTTIVYEHLGIGRGYTPAFTVLG